MSKQNAIFMITLIENNTIKKKQINSFKRIEWDWVVFEQSRIKQNETALEQNRMILYLNKTGQSTIESGCVEIK